MFRKLTALALTVATTLIAFLLMKVWHFSLVHYFLFTTVYLLLMSRLSGQTIVREIPVNNSRNIAILAYMGTALMSIIVYVNYYIARDDIYNNIDHHALALKGWQMAPSDTLFGRSDSALMQDSTAMGLLTYELQGSKPDSVESIILRASNFRRSLFVRPQGNDTAHNVNNTLVIIPDSGIHFTNSHKRRTLQLQTLERCATTWWITPASDTALYVFTVRDSLGAVVLRDTSSYHFFIQKSFALSTLIPSQVVSAFGNDLDGFYITRQRYLNGEGPFTKQNYSPLIRWTLNLKELMSFRNQAWLIEQVSPNDAVQLIEDDSIAHSLTLTLQPGDRFYIGFGTTGTQPMQFDGQGRLLLDLPQWHPLPDEQEQSQVFVTSSPKSISHTENLSPYNILFDVPQLDRTPNQRGNQNLFHTKIAFAKGSTLDSLMLLVGQRQMIPAGKDFIVACERNDNIRAILTLTDFKAESLFQPAPFVRTIIWIFVVAALMVVFTFLPIHEEKQSETKRSFRRIAPTAEIACMMLLMVLFTTRYIICWRLSVFPPMEDISLLEYNSFVRNADVFRHLTFWLPVVLFVCMLVKTLIYIREYSAWKKAKAQAEYPYTYDDEYSDDATRNKIVSSRKLRRLCLILPLVSVVMEFVVRMVLPRGFQILMPVAAYFLIEILLVQVFVGKGNDDTAAFRSLRYNLRFPFVFNYVLHLGLLTLLDAGFGVMFMLFGVMRYYLIVTRYLNYRYYKRRIMWWVVAAIVLALLLTFFFFAPNMLALLMNSSIAGNIFFTVIGSLAIGLFFWLIEEWRCKDVATGSNVAEESEYPDNDDYEDSKQSDYSYYPDESETQRPKGFSLNHWLPSFGYTRSGSIRNFFLRHWWKVAVSVAIATLGVLIWNPYDKVLGPDGHYTHLRYRTKVLVEEWDKTLNNERVSDDKKITRFRQTSENQWILDYYYTNRPTVGDPYFCRQPMSKTGALWGAQSTDLSFLRFGIGEHGISYAIGLLLLMLTVFAIVFQQPKNPRKPRREARRSIAIAALLLILMQGIFVWMSVTNKFIFFGQDFPMLSLTSKMTIHYVAFLLGLAVILSKSEDAENAPTFNMTDRIFSLIFVGLMLLFCVAVHFVVGENRKNKNVDAYLLRLDRVERVLYAHNKLLRYYQIQANKEYNKLVLSKNQGLNYWGKKLMEDFNQNIYKGNDDVEDNETTDNKSVDCILPLPNSQHPWVHSEDALFTPLSHLFAGRKGGAYLAMSPDSATLEIRLPNNGTDFNTDDYEVLEKINDCFFDYQLSNRSLKMAKLGRKSALRKANDSALEESRQMLESGDATAFVADYLAFIDEARSHRDSIPSTLRHLIDGVDAEEVSGATFTNSLIDAYLTTYSKSNDPTNIIYLRRDHATGYLQFFINKEFFRIPKLGKALWKGDIVSSDAYEGNLLYKQGNHKETGKWSSNARFDIARLPASWLMGEKDQYLFRAKASTDMKLKANERLQLHSGESPWTAVRLSDTDGASIPQSDGTVSISLPNDTYHVLAKNVWVNGRRKLIYPLGEAFFWMRPYADYVSTVMRDSVQMSPEATTQNHVISIDWELTRSLYSLLDSIGGAIRQQGGDKHVPNLSVFVGNSDGEILAMNDYNANPIFRVDPNDDRRLNQMHWRASLFSDFSDDRGLNGNFNLLPLMIGPGSSLKPLTFAAVASTVRENWNTFRLVGSLPDGVITAGVDRYASRDFNLRNPKDRFRSIFGDEPHRGQNDFDVARYLYQSSNFFNSVIVYLGSYSEASLQGGVFANANDNFTRITLTNSHRKRSLTYGEEVFPVIRRNKQLMHFSQVFDAQGADAEPVLMKRFDDLYDVYPYPPRFNKNEDQARFIRNYLDHNTLDPTLRATSLNVFAQKESDSTKRRYMQSGETWALPEPSFIDFPTRADPSEITYSAQIKTLTLGMRRLVNISPLKMGEMFSRVFLLDRHFRFTLSGPRPISHIDFLTPAYDDNPEQFLQMLQDEHTFYQGMNLCAQIGTANYLTGNKVSRDYDFAAMRRFAQETGARGLHLYAKTGTIDNTASKNQSNLLAVIVTNGDMRNAKIQDNLYMNINGRPLKFYTIYMFMDKTMPSGIAKQYKRAFQTQAVLRAINSTRCRQFFEQENP